MNYEIIKDAYLSDRQASIAKNLKHYQGKPCKNNHKGIRFTRSGYCIECNTDAGRKYYKPTGNPMGKPFNEAKKLAKENGERFYFTGKPCKEGHISNRYVTGNECVDCKVQDRINNKQRIKFNAIKRNFNLSEEEYLNLLKSQNNSCAICKQEFKISKFIHVDHCHKTNKVRGILCNKCNTGIGQLQHNSKYLRVAAMYCEYT